MIEPWLSPTHGECYIVSGGTVGKMEGRRTHILFHPANAVSELQGCIALGLGWWGKNLRDSRAAHKLFMQDMAGESAMLFVSGLENHQ